MISWKKSLFLHKQTAEINSKTAGFSSKQMAKTDAAKKITFVQKVCLSDGHLTSWQKYSNQGNKKQNGNLGGFATTRAMQLQ